MHERDGVGYLRGFPDFERGNVRGSIAFGLERVLALLDEVGAPHLRLPVIHLAGTKAKGSTAAMIASIATAAGYRTGLFTQPHLIRVHERFQINGTPIEDQAITALMLDVVRPAVDRLAQRGITGIQQFEAQVALALLWFEQQHVDLAVLETGLGGRLDGTNVVPRPLATVLTPIGHDHMDILGDTLTAIAGEKAAIVKAGVPTIASPQPEEAARVITAVCRERAAPLLLGGRDWTVEPARVDLSGTRFTLEARWQVLEPHVPGWPPAREGEIQRLYDLSTPLLGVHQAMNAGTAALTALTVAGALSRIDLTAVRAGLMAVRWPGRLQVLEGSPAVVLDGAHTAESAEALALAMRTLFGTRRVVLVCGVQADKDLPAVVAPLARIAGAAVATRAAHPRAAMPSVIADALRAAGCPAVEEREDAGSALGRATSLAGAEDAILVTGSLYLVGEILRLRSHVQDPDPA